MNYDFDALGGFPKAISAKFLTAAFQLENDYFAPNLKRLRTELRDALQQIKLGGPI